MKLQALIAELETDLGILPEEHSRVPIDSLDKALLIAMQTIARASDAVSGPATQLLPLPANLAELPVGQCPIKLPSSLSDKNHCRYRGFYHTDYTLPSDYFRDCVERPSDIRPFDELDFTYLFHQHTDNPAHLTMGSGTPIRASDNESRSEVATDDKSLRAFGEEIEIDQAPRLLYALQRARA